MLKKKDSGAGLTRELAGHREQPVLPQSSQRGIAATKKYTLTTKGTKIHEKRQIQLHHEGHEGSEGKPGSAGRRTGFMDFWVGSAVPADRLYAFRLWRPTPRRWITPGGPPVAGKGNNVLFAGETRTVPGSPLHPSSQTFFDG